MVINIMHVFRRNQFWQGINEERVRGYNEELIEAKESLEKINWISRDFLDINNKKVEEKIGIINDEIELCNFYFEYCEKQKGENFDKWVYVKKEDRERLLHEVEWSIKGDCWVRGNGKIRMLIDFDTAGSMTKITLSLQNDSDHIAFITSRYGGCEEIISSHLKNGKSIDKRVREYKEKAEELMREYQYPRYCAELNNIRILEQLLHIKEANR